MGQLGWSCHLKEQTSLVFVHFHGESLILSEKQCTQTHPSSRISKSREIENNFVKYVPGVDEDSSRQF